MSRASHHPDKLALITGGAGFIGTNVADRLLRDGWRVRLFDNFSRDGVHRNIEWLRGHHARKEAGTLEVVVGDVRDAPAVQRAVQGTSRVFHLAAQVAVTTSLVHPLLDFDVNARGTLHLLEAIRAMVEPPSLIFTSTNKVYGHLDDVGLRALPTRYEPEDAAVARRGISECRPLDFHSPYGCSKGAADQYVLDYAHTFGLRAVVFRMSCIYGPHQFGTEDQGWVAHFVIQALQDAALTLYGDGLQVRDVLFVDDLVDGMMAAHDHVDCLAGQAFNIGGSSANTISLLELIELIGVLLGRRPAYRLERWRRADQRYYVSDVEKFGAATGWRPQVGLEDGVRRLAAWFVEHGVAAAPAGIGRNVAS